MHHPSFPTLALTAIASATLLVACGGGGNSDTTAIDPPTVVTPSTATLTLTGIAAVGPLSGATACYDLNDNASCDSTEPSATTGADGRFSLTVDAAHVGRHATLVNVPATAVDSETGLAVGTAFSLAAPATGKVDAHSVAVTPLSTAVVDQAKWMNLSVAQAEAAVQTSLGLAASPLADYVAAGDAQAARLARVVHAMSSQAGALATTAALPADATQALVASVRSGHLGVAAALARGSTAGSNAAVASEVTALVLAGRNLDPTTVATQAGTALAVAGAQSAATPGAFVSVRRFTYTDAGNYNLFAFVGDSTPESDGRYWAHEARSNVVAGQAQPFNRNTAYLDPTAGRWATCDNGWQTVRSSAASGQQPQESVYCTGQTSRTRLAEVDVSGRKMADVVAEMRAWPMPDSAGADTDANGLPVKWGPDPATLGSATFPAGSKVSQRMQLTDIGGTQRFSMTDKPRVVPASGTGTFRQAATFSDFKRMAGNVVDATVVANANNTIFLEDVPATQTDATLRAVKRYRVGFDPAGDAVRFYACDVIDATNVSQNCVVVGDGSSRIDTLADSRVLRFTAGYPQALTRAHQRQRLFVERTGVVFGGHHDLERTVFQQRPNTVAWNALRSALALPETAAPAESAAAGPSTQLRNFSYADAANYSARLFDGDASTADANGYYAANERYLIRSAGQAVPFERNRLFWTGSEWYACPNHGVSVITVKASAPFDSVFCKTYSDERVADTTLTLDGRNMADVVRDIRWYGSRDFGFDYAGWGPNPDVHTGLASRSFPAGATMSYRSTQSKATPLAIALGAGNLVRVPQSNLPFNSWPHARTLEEATLQYPGEFRGSGLITTSTTLFVGSRTAAVAPGPDYTTLIEMRVAFDPATQAAHFYRNYRLRSNNAVTAFTRVLETTYSIQTVGDARILSFAALPQDYEADFGYTRHFAEWQGAVLYAYKDAVPAAPIHSIRLNGVAAQALFSALGVQ